MGAVRAPTISEEPTMQAVTTIGLDIAKSVFQVHGIDAEGKVLIRRQLKRRYVLAFFQKLSPCLVGIEACATSHHWSRELKALGHNVRLMPPAYVKVQPIPKNRIVSCWTTPLCGATWRFFLLGCLGLTVGCGLGMAADGGRRDEWPCLRSHDFRNYLHATCSFASPR